MASKTKFDYQFKLLMLGDSACGKSSIVLRYTNDTFSQSYITTIGIDFKVKTINVKDKIIRLQIWDTAGQERFRAITESYYRGAQGIVLVYDVSNKASFYDVKKWMESITKDTKIILVGNKIDVDESQVQVTTKEGENLAKSYRIQFIETSAKKDTNVSLAFQKIAEELYDSRIETMDKIDQKKIEIVPVVPKPTPKKFGFC